MTRSRTVPVALVAICISGCGHLSRYSKWERSPAADEKPRPVLSVHLPSSTIKYSLKTLDTLGSGYCKSFFENLYSKPTGIPPERLPRVEAERKIFDSICEVTEANQSKYKPDSSLDDPNEQLLLNTYLLENAIKVSANLVIGTTMQGIFPIRSIESLRKTLMDQIVRLFPDEQKDQIKEIQGQFRDHANQTNDWLRQQK